MGDRTQRLVVAADISELETLQRFVEATARRLRLDESTCFDLELAITEAVTNIILHGYAGQPGRIELRIIPRGADIEVRLRDQAPRFDPTTVPPALIDLPLEQRQPGGLGLHLMRHLTDELRYRVTLAGENELRMVKRGVLGRNPEDSS